MSQYTSAALAVPRRAVLVPTHLHVPPQWFHLGTEFSGTRRPHLAFGSVPQQEQTLLLLADDLLRITAAAHAIAT